MTRLQKTFSSAALSGLLLTGCGTQEDEDAQWQSSHEIDVTLMFTSTVSITKSDSWPQTTTWASDHPTCGTHRWHVSWTGTHQYTTGNQLSRTATSEECGVWARVYYDNKGHTSWNAPSANTIDSRSISMPSSHTVLAGSGATLVIPGAHGARHCGGAGTTEFEVKTHDNKWSPVPNTTNKQVWTNVSPTPGSETYRVRCSYPGIPTHYSNEIKITWTSTWCGDGTCNADESPRTCPADCPGCGDGYCNSDEATWCAEDCPLCDDKGNCW